MVDRRSPKESNPGDKSGWAALSTLLSGIVAWGGIGFLLDLWLHIHHHVGLLIGMMVGLATSLYMVVKKFG